MQQRLNAIENTSVVATAQLYAPLANRERVLFLAEFAVDGEAYKVVLLALCACERHILGEVFSSLLQLLIVDECSLLVYCEATFALYKRQRLRDNIGKEWCCP